MLEYWLMLDRTTLQGSNEEERVQQKNKELLCSWHSCLSLSTLPPLGGKDFTVAGGLWSYECRKIERWKYKNMMR